MRADEEYATKARGPLLKGTFIGAVICVVMVIALYVFMTYGFD